MNEKAAVMNFTTTGSYNLQINFLIIMITISLKANGKKPFNGSNQ